MSKTASWRGALLVTLAVFGLLLALDWILPIDDAYIYFRYALNLARGHGYVYNAGEAVEGATGVLWTLVLTPFVGLGLDLELVSRLLGIACSVTTIVLVWRRQRDDGLPVGLALLTLALVATPNDFTASTLIGLETTLYALWLVLLYLLCQEGLDRRSPFLLGGLGVALFMTRPESIALLPLLALGLISQNLPKVLKPLGGYPSWRWTLTALGIWTGGALAVTAWRVLTFGDLVPNSVRAKSVLSPTLPWDVLVVRLQAGLAYSQRFLAAHWALALLALVGLILLARARPFAAYVAAASLGAGFTAVLVNAGDWMPFNRLLTPYLPLLALLSGVSLAAVTRRLWPHARWLNVAGVLLTALVYGQALLPLMGRVPFEPREWPTKVCYDQSVDALRPFLGPTAIVSPEALGDVGYRLADVYMLDFFGLTDPIIARQGRIPAPTFTLGKHYYSYVMSRRPDVFLFHSSEYGHIPFLNDWGYSDRYTTLRVRGPNCTLVIGLTNALADRALPALRRVFQVETVATAGLPKNPGATWPLGQPPPYPAGALMGQ
ncbi:MAG: hypothetical protein KIT87_05250 [Anaerolineae bacterium]|nr:hypothetical protein [Anaerolineae bacterium]